MAENAPLPAEALFARARDRHRAGHLGEAVALYHAALERDPGHRPSLHHLGLALLQGGHPGPAARLLARAVAMAPAEAEPRNGLGVALKAVGRVPEALVQLACAVALEPDEPRHLVNLANTLQQGHAFADAAVAYRRALRLEPDLTEGHWNLAMALLRAGRWEEAWPEFEWRWRRPGIPVHYRTIPEWRGEPFPGRRLLLYVEQGLGDALHFARYVPMAAARGGEVTLECPAGLAPLLDGLADNVAVLVKGEASPSCDLQASLPSLPGIFGTGVATAPAAVPYLKAPPGPAPRLEGAFKIGLVWAGSPRHAGDAQRSCPAELFRRLEAVSGASFFSLQKGPAAARVEKLPFVTDLSGAIADFGDTARLVAQLDLVIGVDTSVVHLAGALARPVWVLLPHLPDWRWLTGRRDSVWYPTARLFRQAVPGCWDGVMDEVVRELEGARP